MADNVQPGIAVAANRVRKRSERIMIMKSFSKFKNTADNPVLLDEDEPDDFDMNQDAFQPAGPVIPFPPAEDSTNFDVNCMKMNPDAAQVAGPFHTVEEADESTHCNAADQVAGPFHKVEEADDSTHCNVNPVAVQMNPDDVQLNQVADQVNSVPVQVNPVAFENVESVTGVVIKDVLSGPFDTVEEAYDSTHCTVDLQLNKVADEVNPVDVQDVQNVAGPFHKIEESDVQVNPDAVEVNSVDVQVNTVADQVNPVDVQNVAGPVLTVDEADDSTICTGQNQRKSIAVDKTKDGGKDETNKCKERLEDPDSSEENLCGLENLRTRTSPRTLYQTIVGLNDAQKIAVKQMGLGALLEMTINGVPTKLGFFVVDNLDVKKMELKLLYVESTISPKVVVEHKGHAISSWTLDLLKKRQSTEIKDGGFGLLPLRSKAESSEDVHHRYASNRENVGETSTPTHLSKEV
ncbi:hypothetical protein Ccrd_018569 [Cynara cardunculus var. scolymus]|uniref:Uncharacterized protein n=1 Tax=Cynara cardunculus var. scolymus TaxID=59895 RepID=A0A118K1P6_CYNCS|nr:hypothetical protein Ccrd_018569 [Cynara cardunculus var. scolymus]